MSNGGAALRTGARRKGAVVWPLSRRERLGGEKALLANHRFARLRTPERHAFGPGGVGACDALALPAVASPGAGSRWIPAFAGMTETWFARVGVPGGYGPGSRPS